MTSSRTRRQEALRQARRRTRTLWFAGAVVALAAIVALIVGGGAGTKDASGEYGTPSIQGTKLPEVSDSGADPAVGRRAPVLRGAGFDGRAVSIGATGRAQLILFVAHWCPHCRAEVPRLVEWLASGEIDGRVPIVAVATGTDPRYVNFPPSSWLAHEGWTGPVLVDSKDRDAGQVYGLTAFPYFVAVDRDGRVVARRTGELTLAEVRALLAAAAGN